MAQAVQREESIRKMATLAKAEKTEIMASQLREKQKATDEPEAKNEDQCQDGRRKRSGSSSSSSPESATSSQRRKEKQHKRDDKKRTNEQRLEEEAARRYREQVMAERRREIVREDRMERAGLKNTKA